MNIYIIDKREHFTSQQISLLEKKGKLNIIEGDNVDLYAQEFMYDQEPKILAFSPERINWRFPSDLIGKIPNLKAICLPTTGYDVVDVSACDKRGVTVTNVPHYSTDSVAEYAIYLMLCLARELPLQIKSGFKTAYDQEMKQDEIRNKTMGIVGLGDIGSRIAEIGAGIGMKVMYWSRNRKIVPYEYVEQKELIKKADFIFPAVALNAQTRNLLSQELLSGMKKGACLVDISHEGTTDREFLIGQAAHGRIAGFAFESKDADIMKYEGNVMVTYRYAWYTKESFENDMRIWVETIASVCDGRPVNVVKVR